MSPYLPCQTYLTIPSLSRGSPGSAGSVRPTCISGVKASMAGNDTVIINSIDLLSTTSSTERRWGSSSDSTPGSKCPEANQEDRGAGSAVRAGKSESRDRARLSRQFDRSAAPCRATRSPRYRHSDCLADVDPANCATPPTMSSRRQPEARRIGSAAPVRRSMAIRHPRRTNGISGSQNAGVPRREHPQVSRGHFPSDGAASKLIWLALRNITADWGRAAKEWRAAMNQFAILYEERFTLPAHGNR